MSTGNWAGIQVKQKDESYLGLINIDYLEYLPNRLTPVYSKNYYKEENYLTVKTIYLNT